MVELCFNSYQKQDPMTDVLWDEFNCTCSMILATDLEGRGHNYFVLNYHEHICEENFSKTMLLKNYKTSFATEITP